MEISESTTSRNANGAIGLEFVDLNAVKPNAGALSLAPGDFALKHQVLPIRLEGETLVVGIGGLESLAAVDDLGILLNRPVKAVQCEPGLIRNRIEEHFLEQILSGLSGEDSAPSEYDDTTDLADLQKMAGETAVVQMVNLIFAQAVRDGASDIHIEPYEREVKVRYRIDGMLQEMMRPPKRMQAALISRIKILGEMNIAERRLPQDGRIKITIAGRPIDVRVSIVPTVFGERAVMRILDKSTAMLGLEELGMLPDTLEKFRKLIRIPHGIILVTGPTGTGQSRTPGTRTTTNANTRRNTNTGGNRLRTENGEPDPNELEIALQDPSKDSGELLTQVFEQGFGGMSGGQRRTTGTGSQSFGRDASGRVVNVRDLSGQITVIPDNNTNSIIVVTMPENADLVKQILEQLDKIPEQVMIETIIVEATLDASDKLGVEWKFTEQNVAGDRGNTGVAQTDFGLKSAANTLQGFKYTMTGGKLESFLNMIKTDSKFQVLSTPRIFTANNSQAEINISQSIPYVLSQREDANGNITYNYAFEDVGIVLTITPRITSDGYVTMDITQTANDLQGYTDFNAPIVNQRRATTTVSVKDTETIILGGIIRNTVNATTKKIPLLGDVPLLGNLFKSTSREKAKTELMVFLTPRVVRNPEDAKKLVDEQKNLLSDPSKKSLNTVFPQAKKDDKQELKSDGKGPGNGTNQGGSK